MLYLKQVTVLICLFVFLFLAKPVQAVDWEQKQEDSLEVSLYIMLPAVLLLMSMHDGIEESKPATRRYRREQKARREERLRKLQENVPDMLVKEIHYDENNGKWQMRLEDPDNPENYAVLRTRFWPNNRPAKEVKPIIYLQEGDRVIFEKPENKAEGRSSWFLYDDMGNKIGYAVPDDVQLENYSTPF